MTDAARELKLWSPGANLDLLSLNLPSSASAIPFRVLTCGDGDLSYSLALSNSLNQIGTTFKMTATCFLEGDALDSTHPNARNVAEALRDKGVEVMTGIDATQLHSKFSPQAFDRIVWNFPQHPGTIARIDS
jgi:hypothetical protein